MAKITKATFKSFLRKNAGKVFIKNLSEFDGMTDCNQSNPNAAWRLAAPSTHNDEKYDCGIGGVYLMGSSGNYFEAYAADGYTGIEVSNCCGNFIVAVKN